MGQMGFMIMTCGLGVYAAAIFHLFAHGMYKATLFLGSGSAVHAPFATPRHRLPHHFLPRPAPARQSFRSPFRRLALYGAVQLFFTGIDPGAWGLHALRLGDRCLGLLGLAAPSPFLGGALVSAFGVSVIAGAYVLLLSAAKDFLAPSLAGAGDASVSPWWVVAFFGLLLAAGAVRFASSGGRLAEVRKSAYVLALGAGQVIAPRSRRGSPPDPLQTPAGRLMPSSEGAGS